MSYPFIKANKPFLVKKDNPAPVKSLVAELRKAIPNFPDKRTGTNTRLSQKEFALSAFSRLDTQNPSFLQFQRDMNKTKGLRSAQTLFQIDTILIDKSHKRHFR